MFGPAGQKFHVQRIYDDCYSEICPAAVLHADEPVREIKSEMFVESVLTEYLMSRLITQASGYQADPDHAAQLSHHGESFSFLHPQVTTG